MSPTPMLPEPEFVLILEKRRVLWSLEVDGAVNARRPVALGSITPGDFPSALCQPSLLCSFPGLSGGANGSGDAVLRWRRPPQMRSLLSRDAAALFRNAFEGSNPQSTSRVGHDRPRSRDRGRPAICLSLRCVSEATWEQGALTSRPALRTCRWARGSSRTTLARQPAFN